MAEELGFKLKMMKSLYGFGMKGMGDSLLAELRKGSPEWMTFAEELLDGQDYPRRKTILKQLTGRNFIERSKQKDRVMAMLMEFLGSKNALNDEKKIAVKFVMANLGLFPTDDDAFQGKILSLQRERDPSLSALADELLPKIGVNMNDRDLYKTR